MTSETVVVRMFTASIEQFSVDRDGAVRDENGKIVGTVVEGVWPDSPFEPHTLIIWWSTPPAPPSRRPPSRRTRAPRRA